MSNQLSNEVLAQLYAQESTDPFLTLLTLTHEEWDEDLFFVNNSEEITSRSQVFMPFPFSLVLPADDGETAKVFKIQLDNVTLLMIDKLRSITSSPSVKMEMILASIPDDVQISQEDLLMTNITYNSQRITGTLVLDNFLNTEVTSERYGPKNFPGLF